jgi:5-methylcytosine-specific restriction endonuclease McrA
MGIIEFLTWMFSKEYYDREALIVGGRAPGWDKLRASHLKFNPVCEICGTRRSLEVHHSYPVHLFPELEMIPEFLITLCREHHYTFGHLCNWKNFNEVWNERIRLGK